MKSMYLFLRRRPPAGCRSRSVEFAPARRSISSTERRAPAGAGLLRVGNVALDQETGAYSRRQSWNTSILFPLAASLHPLLPDKGGVCVSIVSIVCGRDERSSTDR